MFKVGECYDPAASALKDAETEYSATAASDNLQQAWNGCPVNTLPKMDNEALREVLKYTAVVLFAILALYILCILCSCKAIYMGIRVTKTAARFVFNNRSVLMIPIVQILVLAVVMATWIVLQLYIFVDPPVIKEVPAGSNKNQADNICVPEAQFAYCSERGSFAADTGLVCEWSCAPESYNMASWQFWFGVFNGFWMMCLIIAFCQMVIAFAASFWFFRKPQGCLSSIWYALRYHMGSLCFGSVLVAAMKTLRAWIQYQQAVFKRTVPGGPASPQAQLASVLFCAAGYCLWCVEKCIKFVNKNAYIYIALKGTTFCTAAKDVFKLIFVNCRRIAWLTMISGMVNLLSILMITAATTIIGYLILMALYPPVNEQMNEIEKQKAISSAVGPCIIYGVIGYMIAKLYMTVYGMATSTILVCAIEAESLDIKGTQFDDDPALQSIYDKAKEDSKASDADKADES